MKYKVTIWYRDGEEEGRRVVDVKAKSFDDAAEKALDKLEVIQPWDEVVVEKVQLL